MDREHIERLIEDNDSLFHARVAKIQLQAQEIKERMSHDFHDKCVEELEEFPEKPAAPIIQRYQELNETSLQYLKHNTAQLITAERIEMKKRSIAILDLQEAH